MNIEYISDIINDCDPIGLFPAAPVDEYDEEINKISEFLITNKNISQIELASYIKDVFLSSFGASVFKAEEKECISIAKKIKNH